MNNGIKILRRVGTTTDSQTVSPSDAGCSSSASSVNPVTQFIPMQAELAWRDLLNEHITRTGTGVFAVPPGVADGDKDAYWGGPCSNDRRFPGRKLTYGTAFRVRRGISRRSALHGTVQPAARH